MRIQLLCLAILMAWHTPAVAGLLGAVVDFADPAKLSEEGLEALKESEFAVFQANVQLYRAKDAEKQVESDLKGSRAILETKGLDLKAAKANWEKLESQ